MVKKAHKGHKARAAKGEAPIGSPQEQQQWAADIKASAYTVTAFVNKFQPATRGTVAKWLDGQALARNAGVMKMRAALDKVNRGPRCIPRHPSYGYATADQWRELQGMMLGKKRDELIAQIEFQNKNAGKLFVK